MKRHEVSCPVIGGLYLHVVTLHDVRHDFAQKCSRPQERHVLHYVGNVLRLVSPVPCLCSLRWTVHPSYVKVLRGSLCSGAIVVSLT